VRGWLRSSARLRALYRGLRGFVLGPPPPPPPKPPSHPVEDRVALLGRVSLVRSPRTGYRLNLVVPTVDAARTFGGIRTALNLFEAVGIGVDERRIVSMGPVGPTLSHTVHGYVPVEAGDDPAIPSQLVGLDRPWAPLAVRSNDVFVATFWPTAELVGQIRRWQASTYGPVPARFVYVVQDYEPGFYPWSAQWLLARATYAQADETIAVFNTSMLRAYFHETGIRFAREFTFEPRMLPELRAAMDRPPVPRSRMIVVYGRPGTPRNAFPAIVDGLRAWVASDPEASTWELVSVGQVHNEIDFGGGSRLRSIGKLDLDAYADLLRSSAIGISLMVSPHPSYPPLEMAHLGMLVLTNRFVAKDLATWHSNIRTTDDVSAGSLAAHLSALCRRFEADPDIGAAGSPSRLEFTADTPQFPFAAELAAALGVDREVVGAQSSTDRPG
jgi:O-antigen biosynthesis protein